MGAWAPTNVSSPARQPVSGLLCSGAFLFRFPLIRRLVGPHPEIIGSAKPRGAGGDGWRPGRQNGRGRADYLAAQKPLRVGPGRKARGFATALAISRTDPRMVGLARHVVPGIRAKPLMRRGRQSRQPCSILKLRAIELKTMREVVSDDPKKNFKRLRRLHPPRAGRSATSGWAGIALAGGRHLGEFHLEPVFARRRRGLLSES